MPMFEFKEWGTAKAGSGYGGQVGDRWCAIIECKRGMNRGNHVHSFDQFTVLLKGREIVVMEVDGELVEVELKLDTVHRTPAGVNHLTVALDDSVAYEWWDGPSSMETCPGVFDEYLKIFREKMGT